MKGKEVKEKYTKLKTESQRIEGEIRKPSYMNKEIEENSRMDKTRDLFKKIGDIKGTFHARMGMIKNSNDKGLAE